ncbi:hypothetical protein [Marispirochaeta sp.]|uniref:hypothetical protein n=1 Tax=Marispirochaeta sp. TaxID=2038653 RepID=UPI0029C90CAB|nr:hypothetical protein [Marispirochaeta sp.]
MALRLNNIENARKSLSRVLRDYDAGKMDEKKARTEAYIFEKLLQFFKFEKENSIEAELSEIREIIEGLQK